MKRLLAIALVCCFGLNAMGAATTQPADAKVDVDALVKKLASSEYAEREEAAGVLSKAFARHGEEIEAASKRADLDPQAAMSLQEIVSVQKPRTVARARAERIAREDIEKNGKSALEWYEKVGRRDPKWDATARQVIETFTGVNARHPDYPNRTQRLDELGQELEKLGCDDPLARYFVLRGRGSAGQGDMAALAGELKDVVDAIEASEYPPLRKCWAQARYVEFILKFQLWQALKDWKSELGHRVDLAVEHWPATVRDRSMTDTMASELAGVLEYDWTMVKGEEAQEYGDRKKLCDRLLPVWEQAMAGATGPLVFKGALYARYAWDARGSGYANTVTNDGWKLMRERLDVAQKALEKAYAMDPADPRAAREMMTIELGQGEGRERMELWWKRAMQADPDNYAACTSKLYYLEPKWYGSADAMIDFGRECLRGGNWEGRIPFVLVDAHEDLSKYASDPDEYYTKPEVWKDLKSVYEPFLARYPNAVWDRSYFAWYATQCGQWDEAKKQFDLLGDNPELKPFGTKEAYEYLRDRAKNGGKP